MNKYMMYVGNAAIPCQGHNEQAAMENLGLFEIGDMVDFVRTSEPESRNNAWIYQVEVKGKIQMAYIKRVG